MKKGNKEQDKKITELVNLYFQYNPDKNKGMAWRIKAWDIISSYYVIHKKPYDEIKHCIESKPMCQVAIWEQFKNHFTKKDINNKGYKKIQDSTNVDDWL